LFAFFGPNIQSPLAKHLNQTNHILKHCLEFMPLIDFAIDVSYRVSRITQLVLCDDRLVSKRVDLLKVF
jgi:hypothetical protein